MLHPEPLNRVCRHLSCLLRWSQGEGGSEDVWCNGVIGFELLSIKNKAIQRHKARTFLGEFVQSSLDCIDVALLICCDERRFRWIQEFLLQGLTANCPAQRQRLQRYSKEHVVRNVFPRRRNIWREAQESNSMRQPQSRQQLQHFWRDRDFDALAGRVVET